MYIFTDGVTKISYANNNLRVTLVQNGPENSQIDAGTLIIPGNQAANFVKALATGLQQLDEQIKAQREDKSEEDVVVQ